MCISCEFSNTSRDNNQTNRSCRHTRLFNRETLAHPRSLITSTLRNEFSQESRLGCFFGSHHFRGDISLYAKHAENVLNARFLRGTVLVLHLCEIHIQLVEVIVDLLFESCLHLAFDHIVHHRGEGMVECAGSE